MTGPVRYEVADGVATITLDAPETRNALSGELIAGLRDALEAAAADPDARCVVVGSSHETTWCAGGDLRGFGADEPAVHKHRGFAEMMRLFERICDYPKPTLAAVNGHALAGGMGLALCFDLVIASERAAFGTPEINVGVFPFMIMAVIFRNVPRKRANELLLLGERISAEDARELGIVNRVVGPDAFGAAVADWAAALAAKSPLLIQMGKEAMARQRDMPLRDALDYLRSQLSLAQTTDDIREGVTAFFEKREPRWTGR